MLRFAPRYGIVSPALVRSSRQPRRFAANDNALDLNVARASKSAALADARVQAALRLFAVHGLSAAERARQSAANANARGDDSDAQWWSEISQMLGQRRRP
jgi:hypothetical protein